MTPKIKFTAKFIQNLSTDSGQLIFIDECPQPQGYLCLRVGKKRKSWFIQFRSNGKRKKLNIGTYPSLSLADARLLATEKLTSGPQPNKHTVSDLWTEYQKVLERKSRKKADTTLAEEQRVWTKDIEPVIGNLKLTDITPAILANLLDSKAETAPVAANRMHSLLSIMFKPALRLGWITTHPLQWIEKPRGHEEPRKRVLSDDEIRILWPHFEQLKTNARDMLKLGLLTAQRPGEIAAMKWEHIDLEAGVWTQENTKNGSTHVLPLVGTAMDIILDRWEGQTEGYVFPTAYNGGYSPNTQSARNRVQRETGVDGWTAHDLRRTARTIMSRLQIDQHVRVRVLNHSQKGVVGVYDQYDYLDEKRDALIKLDQEIRCII